MSDTNPTSSQGFLQFLVRRRKEVAYGLCIGALAVVGLMLWLGLSVYPAAKVPIFIWGGGVTLALLAMGLVQLFHEPELESELRAQRLTVLAAGAWVGLMTTVASVLFAYYWWNDLLSWLEPTGERQNGGGVLLMAVALVVGLAVMFFSLQLARAEERTSPGFRRLLYGYNSALTLLLLVFNLLVFNCLVTARTREPIDFSSSGVYTLSNSTENVLRNLKEQVTVVVILDNLGQYGNLDVVDHMRNLINNCRERSDKFKGVVLDPNTLSDIQQLAALEKEFPNITVDVPPTPQNPRPGRRDFRRGALVVVDTGGKPRSHFIPDSELFTIEGMGMGGGDSAAFKGEDVLMTQLQYLMDEQRKPVLYFTQGNGEPDLNLPEDSRLSLGLGQLRQRLEKWNYEVKPLTFSAIESKVPGDAELVVVVGPQRPLPDYALKALRDYLANRGKMAFFLGLVVGKDGTVRQTGLEGLLAAYGVRLPDERVLDLSTQPNLLFADVNSANPLGADFKAMSGIEVEDPRPVEGLPPSPMSARHRVDTLLVTSGRDAVFREGNLALTPLQAVQRLRTQPKEAVLKRLAVQVPVAVTVSESSLNPADPHAAMRGKGETKPKLVVFGSSVLAANRSVSERERLDNFDLIRSSVEWLRERPASIGIGPKTHNFYQLDKLNVDPWRLALLPGGLVILALAGLGVGVAVVRRR